MLRARLLAAVVAASSALAALTSPAVAAGGDSFADGYAEVALAAMPACPEAAARCFGLRLHVAADEDGHPVVDSAWLAAQVTRADEVFADVAVGFEVTAVLNAGPAARRVLTRDDRDRVGRASRDPRVIDVWVVAQLANVDDPGDIRGVHWRDRAHRDHRWILLSAIVPAPVLAHELGHFFGLPHSREPASLMNKTGEDPTPFAERRFATKEQRRVGASAARFARAGAPVDRRRPRAGARSAR